MGCKFVRTTALRDCLGLKLGPRDRGIESVYTDKIMDIFGQGFGQ